MCRHAWKPSMASVLLILVTACGGSHEYIVVGTNRAPGADGTVQVEEIEGGNSLVTVSLSSLPPPGRLGDGMTAYVVWIEGDGQPPVKAGLLQYDEETRQGNMMATTPLTQFDLRVTAERDGEAESPSEVVAVQREVRRE